MRIRSALAVLAAICAACNGPTDVRNPPPNCPPGEASGLLNLAVGGVAVFNDAVGLACVTMSSVAADRDLLFIVSNASTAPKQVASLTVVADASADVVAAMSRDFSSSAAAFSSNAPSFSLLASQPADSSVAIDSVRMAFESRLHEQERLLPATLPPVERAALAGPVGSRSFARASLAVSVGDTLRSYNVPNINAGDACKNVFSLTAVVKAVGTNVIVVQDTAAPASGFTPSDFTNIAAETDTALFPTDTTYFGRPSDKDGNGRIIILYTPRVNALTPHSSQGYVGGFFFGGDLYSRPLCANSNQAEIIYMLVPDPSAAFSIPHTVSQVRQDTRGTIAHEMQHMINKGKRLAAGSQFEVTWLDEALAHFAEELAGRDEKGWTATKRITQSDLSDIGSQVYLNSFFKQNLTRYRLWLAAPDKKGAIGADADTSLAVRGAAWALVRYVADRYAASGVTTFTRALASGPDTGVTNLTNRTGVPFDTLLAGWMIANFEASTPSLPAKYTYASWGMRSALQLAGTGFPLAVTLIGTTIDLPLSSPPASGRYLRFTTSATSPPFAFKVLAGDHGLITSVGSPRLYVVRLQ